MIAYHQFISEMLAAVPELRLPYQRLKTDWKSGEKPGPHVVLADAVVPFLDEALAGGHAKIIDSVMGFAERALAAGDDRVIEAIGQSLLEPMSDRPALLHYALRTMGSKTRALAEEVL